MIRRQPEEVVSLTEEEQRGPGVSAGEEKAQMLARTDAAELIGAVRGRVLPPRLPSLAVTDPIFHDSTFIARLAQAREQNWPAEMRGAYFEAFVQMLAIGDVALVRRRHSPAGADAFHVVDLNDWEPRDPDFRLGRVWTVDDPDSGWKKRARWRGLRQRRGPRR